VIFNSYVSLPEGKPFFWVISAIPSQFGRTRRHGQMLIREAEEEAAKEREIEEAAKAG